MLPQTKKPPIGIRHQIQVYLFKEGEPCADFIEELAVKLAIVGQAANLDNKVRKSDKRCEAILASVPIMQALIYSNSWDSKYAPMIDKAVESAASLLKIVNPFCINLVQLTLKENLYD